MINLPRAVKGPAFTELLRVMVGRATTFGVITPVSDLSVSSVRFLEVFEAVRIAKTETREWPGTLVPDWAPPLVVHTFGYDEEAAILLPAACPDLYGWQDRSLPYDLHLLAADGSVVLASITSERDAWADMTMEEWEDLIAGTQALKELRVKAD
jgi:hypothetical protein